MAQHGKTILIGDIHSRSCWKLIVHNLEKDASSYVFIGDYFDTHDDISTAEQIHNFKEIVQFKIEQEKLGKEVVLLVGNHDGYIYPEMMQHTISGYQEKGAFFIQQSMQEVKEHLQMAYQFENILCTHAGVSETFMNEVFGKEGWKIKDIAELLNDLWKYKPRTFLFNGREQYGDDIGQTPIWIRPRSLMKDSQKIKKKLIQIVGHTQQNQIDIKGKATGGKYFFIDTLGTSGEYLTYEDGKFKTNKI